jgi:two-component system, sensor histidine kinase LadS
MMLMSSPGWILLQVALITAIINVAHAAPAEPLLLENKASYNLSGHLEMLKDPTRQLTVSDAATRHDWTGPVREQFPNLGITQSAIWLRFSLTNRADISRDFHVSFDYPVANSVTFFLKDKHGGFQEEHVGSSIPASANVIPDRHFLFPLTIKPGKTAMIYMRIQSTSGMTIPILILSDQAVSIKAIRDYTLYGVLFGFLLLMLVYFIVVGSFLYKGTSLWLALYSVLFGLHTAIRAGFIRLLVPDELIVINSILQILIIAGLYFTGAKFFRAFLSLRKYSKSADLVMAFFQYLSIAFILLPLFPFPITAAISCTLMVINPVFSICLAFYLWRKGVSNAGYFATGWIVAHSVSVYDFFRINGVLPYPSFGEWLIPFSFLIALLFLSVALIKQNAYDHLMAGIDPLTFLANRRKFDEVLYNEWNRCLRHRTPMSVIMADVDYFKEYNDSFGHKAGDECLCRLADVLKQNARRTGDLAVRYGGDEFVLLLPNLDAAGAFNLAETIRYSVESTVKIGGTQLTTEKLTISLGVATTIPEAWMKPESPVLDADKAMYAAKHAGRNRTVVFASVSN